MGRILFGVHRPEFIHRLPDHVQHAAQRGATYRHGDGTAEVERLHAAHHSFGRFHGDAAYPSLAQVLLHLEDYVERRRHLEAFAGHAQCLINRRHMRFVELNVHRRSRHFDYVSDIFCHDSLSKSSDEPL